ncbi:hypothetical protein OB13_01790 [Pontibacter sp. HJ8]
MLTFAAPTAGREPEGRLVTAADRRKKEKKLALGSCKRKGKFATFALRFARKQKGFSAERAEEKRKKSFERVLAEKEKLLTFALRKREQLASGNEKTTSD